MEKYKKWTDASMGINPFVQMTSSSMTKTAAAMKSSKSSSSSMCNRALSLLCDLTVRPALFLMRATMLLTITCAALCFNKVFMSFRAVHRCVNALYGRLALLIMGFWSIDTQYMLANGRKQSELSPGQLVQRWASGLGHGDLIIANHISYADVLYLGFRFSPVFATVVAVQGSSSSPTSIRLVKQSFVEYLMSLLLRTTPLLIGESVHAEFASLKEILLWAKKNGRGPVVLFAEGCTSNGQAILQFQSQLIEPDLDRFMQRNSLKMHLCAFRYEYQHFSPAYNVPGLLPHLYGMLTQMYNAMQVRIVENALASLPQQQQQDEFDVEEVRRALARCHRMRMLNKDLTDKMSFLEYWRETQQRGYAKKM